MDLTASDAAQLCGLSVRSVNTLYPRIHVRLARECAAQSPFPGKLEVDESYFGPKRIRGKVDPNSPSTPTAGVGRGIHCASIRCMKEGVP